MEVKANLGAGDRASTQFQAQPQTQARIRAELAESEGRKPIGTDGSGLRAGAAGDEAFEAQPKSVDELADRVRLIANAMASRGSAASGLLDRAEADVQARLTSLQIRDLAGEAWTAQANISPRSALSLLSE